VLALNEGHPEEAVEVLRRQSSEDPDDPLLRFELGRALLASEQFADAATELGAAREEVGFLALDRVGLLQIGLIEAEALIGAGDAHAAHRVLVEAIDEVGEELGLMFLRGRVEAALGDHDGLEQTMAVVMKKSPQAVDAAIVLAESRIHRKDLDGAVEVLEGGLKRYCATGTCHAQPISLPAARLLARTYLDLERDPGRVEDLLLQVQGSLEGHVPWGDHVLWGRLHRQRGDHEKLAESRRAALDGLPEEHEELRGQVEALLA
jgi:tetratricopeptide (TPR) repeat protein